MERIINSNIDTDFYKLTMGQAVFNNYSNLKVGYEFINRGKTEFPNQFDKKLERQIEMMSEVRLQPNEKRFLQEGCNGVFTEDYINWYQNYQFDPSEVKIRRENGGLAINTEGLWERTIYWEVPLMATISELYFQETNQKPNITWEDEAKQKALLFKSARVKLADFGSRRRYSFAVHNRIIEIFKQYGQESFIGTSNVELAMIHNLPPTGTFAHELVMAHAGIVGPEKANRKVLELWAKEFNGKLTTALTDTLSTEVFLRDFDNKLAETYKKFRQDSGSPEQWTEKIISHLITLGIDPLTRTALYSDSLNPQRVLEIMDYTKNRINVLFGIGTNLTNDVGVKPLNMVIKLLYILTEDGKRQGLCKISDDPEKTLGNLQAITEWKNKLKLII